MAITAVFFDLDGTLLPMDQDHFIKTYFKRLSSKAAASGYDPDIFMNGILKGLGAMVKNDGRATNENVFMKVFATVVGEITEKETAFFDSFYENDFQLLSSECGYDPQAKDAVYAIKNMGLRTVLATNPVFPPIATHSRIKWAGLDKSDFEYITTYENSSYSKPDPGYYSQILENLGLKAKECLMVGNDVTEDMAAEKLGMKVFLLTPCLINKENKNISAYKNGGFEELAEYIKTEIR